MPFHKVIALPPANNEIACNNFGIFYQEFLIQGLEWLIHGPYLAPMLEQDFHAYLLSDCEETTPQTPQRLSFEANRTPKGKSSRKQRLDALISSKLKGRLRAPPSSLTPEHPTFENRSAALIHRAQGQSLSNKLEKVALQRADTMGATVNPNLSRKGSVLDHFRRSKSTRTVRTEARCVEFAGQRKKEGRDLWGRIKGWVERNLN
jgi:hypothetical protein